MDDLRFRSQRSPRDDNNPSATMSLVTPPRNGSRMPQRHHQQQASAVDSRSNLPRRFTTESGRVPTLSSVGITSPQRAPEPSQEYGNAYHKVHLIEKKKQEYERIREQRRRFEVEMQRLDQEYRREARELAAMEEEVRLGGHQSEPTTPPEHHSAAAFPSFMSRPARYSMSSLASPPGFHNRPNRPGSTLISPPSGMVHGQGRHAWNDTLPSTTLPSRSTPTTRRNSDDEERADNLRQNISNHRSAHGHRYSMPGSRPGNGPYESGLDRTNVTGFLFDDEDSSAIHSNGVDERFPTLVRHDDQMLSASSAALDLALSSSPIPELHSSSNWTTRINRHRTQQSMSAINGPSTNIHGEQNAVGHRPASLRQSLDLQYISENSTEAPDAGAPAQPSQVMATPPQLQSSYSANDVPTLRNASNVGLVNNGNANNHAQQHFHNHNASMGRIPAGAVPTRGHSRELSNDSSATVNREQATTFQSLQSALQPNAAPFGPSMIPQSAMNTPQIPAHANPGAMNAYNGYYPQAGFVPSNGANGAPANYGMNMITNGMQQMSVNGNGIGGNNMYPAQNFTGYSQMPYNQGTQQPRDSQARVIANRRQVDNEAMSRYQNMPLESFCGQIYDLCKDQHGCRYLQKKLEERIPEQVHMIWLETNPHVVELMTDPFGNYLCQKLLEFCTDDDRTVLIQNASQDMVRIALNTHGTRALQKMIEYVGTPQQVHLIIEALRHQVVELIQDLNGNHVIQKCLNKLTSADAQFIFDAVGSHCVDVGTHRHGCCVLQRCIDHASGDQKLWLIQRITDQSRILVQDPFGNYVVQYIIDLNEPLFTEPIVRTFQGCISQLSRHKFSSNVIEKCLRCSQPPSKDMIVEEMLTAQEPERLIRDSYANYVVQTALEYATPQQKHRLVEAIRPILPTIRNTPYGRRLQTKITQYDSRGSAASSGQVTPADNTQGQIPLQASGQSQAVIGNGPMLQGNNNFPNGGNMASSGADQAVNSYQHNGVVSNAPQGPGGAVQQPPYNQGHYNGQHQTGRPSSQSNGGSWM